MASLDDDASDTPSAASDGRRVGTLVDLSLDYCLANPQTYCVLDASGGAERIRPDAFIPPEVGDRLVARLAQRKEMNDAYLKLFSDPTTCRLCHLKLAHSPVTDEGLGHVASQGLVELDLTRTRVGENLLQILEPCRHTLHSLILNETRKAVLSFTNHEWDDDPSTWHKPDSTAPSFPFTQLKVLELSHTGLVVDCLHPLLLPLKHLVALNLSGTRRKPHNQKHGCNWGELVHLHYTLRSLVLHQCDIAVGGFNNICQLKELRHLDVSSSTRMCRMLKRTHGYTILAQFSTELTNLTSLDISDTILPHHERDSPQVSDSEDSDSMDPEHLSNDSDCSLEIVGNSDSMRGKACQEEYVPSVIRGLQHLKRPLQFLGLLKTPIRALDSELPALKCAGVQTEEQALTAIEHYCQLDRLQYVHAAFKALLDIVNDASDSLPVQHLRAMKAVIMVMQKLQNDRSIIQLSEACLYQLTKYHNGPPLPAPLKRSIITQMLEVIESYDHDSQLQQFACFVLCNFGIPNDLQFAYRRAATDILRLTRLDRPSQVQRIAIVLCNAIVCQVQGDDKLLMGRLGIINNMVKLIEDRLRQKECDDVLEAAWSTMWNVTDETEDNCQAFLDLGGLDLFTNCYRTFPDKPELLRNMMGLLGNVAEVKKLRPRMLKCILIFSDLLKSESDGIEVSYNAAGIISHILSDGEEAWTMPTPRREDVLHGILEATGRWNIEQRRNINYRSFGPVLRLLTCFHTPHAIHWATWALTNLCTVYPDKYCKLLKKEGGLEKLSQLLEDPQVLPSTKLLAHSTLKRVRDQEETGALQGDDIDT